MIMIPHSWPSHRCSSQARQTSGTPQAPSTGHDPHHPQAGRPGIGGHHSDVGSIPRPYIGGEDVNGVPIGRRNLFSDRRRAVLGIAGVGVALLLVLLLGAIVDGAMRQVTRYIDTAPADVFVAQRGVTNMHMASSAVPLADVGQIRALPGVTWADPILYLPDALATPTGRQIAYAVGYVPGGRGGPASLVQGRPPGAGQVVIDQRAAGNLGLKLGDPVRLLGRDWRISGLTTGADYGAHQPRQRRGIRSVLRPGGGAGSDGYRELRAGRGAGRSSPAGSADRGRHRAQRPGESGVLGARAGAGAGHERAAPADHEPRRIPDRAGRHRPDAVCGHAVQAPGGRGDEGARSSAVAAGA